MIKNGSQMSVIFFNNSRLLITRFDLFLIFIAGLAVGVGVVLTTVGIALEFTSFWSYFWSCFPIVMGLVLLCLVARSLSEV